MFSRSIHTSRATHARMRIASIGVMAASADKALLSTQTAVGRVFLSTKSAACLTDSKRCVSSIMSISQHQQQQVRLYGSKKKGGKKTGSKEKHSDNEDNDNDVESLEMTLDVGKMEEQMKHSIDRFSTELQAVRAGRANPAMLDHIRVLLKGGSAVLSDLAMVAVKDAQNLLVVPNNQDDQKAIDTSIRSAGLGLNPRIDKNAIIVPVPKPTKESRDKLLKNLGALAEHTRVHVRKHRQDAMKCLKNDSKSHMAKDEVKSWEKNIQTVTDKYIAKIEDLLKAKTREIERT
ncbi:hypothetical protein FB645_001011 [Coemansia sp. IMI 203386]|nr:hypothetical protein FB645_001011 [Coemansia sp. IMI 203386]